MIVEFGRAVYGRGVGVATVAMATGEASVISKPAHGSRGNGSSTKDEEIIGKLDVFCGRALVTIVLGLFFLLRIAKKKGRIGEI